jgi:hypothetical protein
MIIAADAHRATVAASSIGRVLSAPSRWNVRADW